MTRLLCAAMVAGALSLSGTALAAQSGPISFDLGAGLTIPTGNFDGPYPGTGARSGLLFTGDASYRITPALGVTAGYGWDRFRCRESGCPPGSDHLVIQGPRAGLTYHFQYLEGVQPWIRGLASYQRPQFTGGDADPGEWGFGYQFAAGLEVPVTDRFAVIPQTRWGRVNTPVTFGYQVTRAADPSWATAELGLRFYLPVRR